MCVKQKKNSNGSHRVDSTDKVKTSGVYIILIVRLVMRKNDEKLQELGLNRDCVERKGVSYQHWIDGANANQCVVQAATIKENIYVYTIPAVNCSESITDYKEKYF